MQADVAQLVEQPIRKGLSLAHILLGHKPTRVFMNPHTGLALRTHDKEQEEEAGWLAGCLMLPREVLLQSRPTVSPMKRLVGIMALARRC